MKTIIACVFLILLCAGTSFADVIYLKNGQKVRGEIFQETGYSYKVKVNGVPTTYYINEVEKVIKGDEPAAPVSAGTAAPAAVSDAKKELVLRLLDANGSRQSMVRIFNQIIGKLPEKDRPAAQAILKVDEVINHLVPVYAKYYTEADLKELIVFYRSPVGAKQVQNTPQLMEEVMQEVTKYFQTKVGTPGGKI